MPIFTVLKKQDANVVFEKDIEADTAEDAFAKGLETKDVPDGWDYSGIETFDNITMDLEDVMLLEDEEDLTDVTITTRQRDTIIAALRMWQASPDDQRIPFADIANDSGRGDLTEEEIDDLIEETINT